jgi:diguanylate cyclase (GGDEF)-like protein
VTLAVSQLNAFSLAIPDDSRRLLALFRISGEAVALAAPGPWRLVYTNSVLTEWLGTPANRSEDVSLDAAFGERKADLLREQIGRVAAGEIADSRLRANICCGNLSDNQFPVEIQLTPVELGQQKCVGLVMHRVTNLQPENFASRRDPLTGLADRSTLLARMQNLLEGDRLGDQRFAVLFIDLDEFKKVNDLHGHMIGDRVLSEVARRLSTCVRAGEQIVRYGGDEFVILIERVAGWEDYAPVISRIHDALSAPIAVPEGELTISASIGAAEVGVEHKTPEELLAAADRAMYTAKRRRITPELAAV